MYTPCVLLYWSRISVHSLLIDSYCVVGGWHRVYSFIPPIWVVFRAQFAGKGVVFVFRKDHFSVCMRHMYPSTPLELTIRIETNRSPVAKQVDVICCANLFIRGALINVHKLVATTFNCLCKL